MSSIHIYPNLSSISQSFPAILLDAYGVFWGGNQLGLIPGAKEAMHSLVSQGKIVGILSNTTQLAAKEIKKLHEYGLIQNEHFHFLLTSGEIGRSIFLRGKLPFKTARKKFWLLGELHPRFSSHHPIFEGTDFQETVHLAEADFIYISIPHIQGEDQIDPQIFRKQLLPLKNSGIPMVCPNPDQFAHEGLPPRAVVRQGSIAALYEELGGQVFYIGKPHAIAYATAMKSFAQYHIMQPNEVLMVGDNPETDIRGARQFGMSAVLITQTGIMADRIIHYGLEQAFEKLTSQDLPNFYMKQL